MKYLILIIFLFLLILNYRATQGFRVTFDNLTFDMDGVETFVDDSVLSSDYPDKCYYAPTGQTWNVGEHWSPAGKCWIARCVKPGVATVFYCGNVSPANDGHTNKYCQLIGMDLQQPYPKCCNRYLCRSLNSRPYIYNPIVAGGGRELPYFKLLSKSRDKIPFNKIPILKTNDNCKNNYLY